MKELGAWLACHGRLSRRLKAALTPLIISLLVIVVIIPPTSLHASATEPPGITFHNPIRIVGPISDSDLQANSASQAIVPPFSPAQIRKAYGIDQFSGTGAGKMIAIVVAYGDAGIAADLHTFDLQFGLADPVLTCHPSASVGTDPQAPGWAIETALDVEWAHAMAPGANILLVVAASPSSTDLVTAVDYATAQGANVISMSWGGAEFAGETNLDSHFNHPGVTYVAATGDFGAAPSLNASTAGILWPASSPYVTAVGGTSLTINDDGTYGSETAWSGNGNSWAGTGGGQSLYETRPGYQNGFQSSAHRQIPDVAFVADTATGVKVYYNGELYQVGGTSLSSPCWAGLYVLADQSGVPWVYNRAAASTYPGNFHDITSGNNNVPGITGYNAGAGYDMVTGLGSPKANNLLAGITTKLAVTGYPSPASAGVTHSFGVTAQDAANNTAASYTGTVHFTSTDSQALVPADYTFVSGDNGTHIFSAMFKTAGIQSITATDTVTANITGTQNAIAVNPALKNKLVWGTQPPAAVTAGAVWTAFTVKIVDQYGNQTSDMDSITIVPSTGVLGGTLSQPAAAGLATFNNITRITSGNMTLTATAGSLTAAPPSNTITVNPAGPLLTVAGFSLPAVAGSTHNFSVTAKDTQGNTITGYSGTVHFTSTDSQAVLPGNYTFTGSGTGKDNGAHSFNASLKTAGTQSITATDTVTANIAGSQSGITVNSTPKNKLVWGTQPPATVTANTTWAAFTVKIVDQYGNQTADADSITIVSSNGSLGGTLSQPAVAGLATFNNITRTAAGTLTLTAIAGTLTAAPPSNAITVNPTAYSKGKIAFTSDRDGNPEIYVMKADGTIQRRLTNSPGYDYQPAWSPDGTKITFVSERNGPYNIYVMNADGSNPVRLTTSSGDWDPTWSPDGSKIAFFSSRTNTSEIYTMNADGTNQILLTNTGSTNWFPSWSPDGGRITFTSDRNGNREIYIMNTDGADQVRLTNNSANDDYPSWSPDGNRIAFTSNRDGTEEIYVMNTDGSGQTRLTVNSVNTVPRWSPDGSRLTFASFRDTYQQIYTMNADGSGQIRISNNSYQDSDTAWGTPPAVALTVSGYSSPAVAGSVYDFSVTAKDTYGDTATSYYGTAHFTSTDGQALVPADYTFVSGDNGTRTFNATLKTAGILSITATDTMSANITGTQSGITVNPALKNKLVWGTQPPASVTAGAVWTAFTVKIEDQYSNQTADTDVTTLVSANGSLSGTLSQPAVAGLATFNDISRATTGILTLTTTAGTLTAAPPSNTITVNPAAYSKGKIAFTSDRDGNPEIYVMKADGTNQTRLTNNAATDCFPVWSPEGKKIAFMSGPFGSYDIRVMNADGTGLTQLTNGLNSWNPSWSPDGSKIVFGSTVTGTSQIYVMNSNGSNKTQLTFSGVNVWPDWSVDGKILFVSNSAAQNVIYTMNPDGSNQTQITANGTQAFYPKWSSDGKEIVFSSNRDGHDEIFKIDSAGNNESRLTINSVYSVYPQWSPDDSRIVFSSARDGHPQIYVMNSNGTGQTRLSNNSFDEFHPAWGTPPAAALTISGFSSPAVAGSSHDFSVTAKDAEGNTATRYYGTVHFTSTDGQAVVPADYTFVVSDNGTRTFNATLKTAGIQSITATDRITANITGTQSGITVNPAAGTALTVSGYTSPAVAGSAHDFNVMAKDAYGNTATSYYGTVHFTSTDGQALVPADYTFAVSDNGTRTFNATLKTAGILSITATDTMSANITGSQSAITVNPALKNKLVWGTQPPASVTAGAVWTAFTVKIVDQYGNQTADTDVTTLVSANGSLGGTLSQPAVAGLATFNNITRTVSGNLTLTATSGTLTAAPPSNIITVNPAASDATLSGLTLSSGTLTPAFVSANTRYTASVANNVTSVTVTATAHESHAIVTVNGTPVNSGASSGQINLNTGANTVSIVVTAQDTTIVIIYTVTVTRAAASPPENGGGFFGGGGGGGSSVIDLNIKGFTRTDPLKTNSDGIIQESAQILSADGMLTLDIAKGTKALTKLLTAAANLTVEPLTDPPEAPLMNTFVTAYSFGPEGTAFDPPMTLTFTYSSPPANVDENSLRVVYYNGTVWDTVPGKLDTTARTITAQISHCSTYAVIGRVVEPAAPTPTPTPIPSPTPTPPSQTSELTPTPAPTPTPTPDLTTTPTPIPAPELTPDLSAIITPLVTTRVTEATPTPDQALNPTPAAEQPAKPTPLWPIFVLGAIGIAGIAVTLTSAMVIKKGKKPKI